MQMMRCRCVKCGWTFDLFSLPMPATEIAKMRARGICPLCYDTNPVVADSRPLTSEEIAAKTMGKLGTASAEAKP